LRNVGALHENGTGGLGRKRDSYGVLASRTDPKRLSTPTRMARSPMIVQAKGQPAVIVPTTTQTPKAIIPAEMRNESTISMIGPLSSEGKQWCDNAGGLEGANFEAPILPTRPVWNRSWSVVNFAQKRSASVGWLLSGRLTSSNEGMWVLFHHDSSAAPQTVQTASPVCGTKNFV
jgi:hypothetical protein